MVVRLWWAIDDLCSRRMRNFTLLKMKRGGHRGRHNKGETNQSQKILNKLKVKVKENEK